MCLLSSDKRLTLQYSTAGGAALLNHEFLYCRIGAETLTGWHLPGVGRSTQSEVRNVKVNYFLGENSLKLPPTGLAAACSEFQVAPGTVCPLPYNELPNAVP